MPDSDMDDDWQQHGRFDPPTEMSEYFEFAAEVARAEAARLRVEYDPAEDDAECPY